MADGSGPKTAREACGISLADEKRIARELSPDVAWPTLALALAVILPVSFAAMVWVGLSGAWPLFACTPAIAFISYAHYSLVHESVHSNVVARPRSLGWVNDVVGWIGAIGLGSSWPLLQRTHVLHHSHTNTARDPDIFVKGTFRQLLGKWSRQVVLGFVPLFAVKWLNPSQYQRLKGILNPTEIALSSLVTVAQIALAVTAIWTGYGVEWLALWFVPQKLAVLALNIFFQWLPHHPFDHTERYLNTRISLWTPGGPLMLQQNLHLMHHLWPSVPFYNYPKLFRALRPALQAEGSRIEGLMVGAYRKAK
ncbi:MAG: fatty acid desaturase [Micropepsaceae bacterium]